MEQEAEKFRFRIRHIGVNCENGEAALNLAKLFSGMFGFPVKDGKDSVFSSEEIEWMKTPGRGTCGHIGIGTRNFEEARSYLERKGWRFDESSAKFNENGEMIVLYLQEQFGGFAVHLLREDAD